MDAQIAEYASGGDFLVGLPINDWLDSIDERRELVDRCADNMQWCPFEYQGEMSEHDIDPKFFKRVTGRLPVGNSAFFGTHVYWTDTASLKLMLEIKDEAGVIRLSLQLDRDFTLLKRTDQRLFVIDYQNEPLSLTPRRQESGPASCFTSSGEKIRVSVLQNADLNGGPLKIFYADEKGERHSLFVALPHVPKIRVSSPTPRDN